MNEILPPGALEVLRTLCDGAPLVVFDLETTGPDRLTDRIVEVAAVKVAPDGEVSVFETRVNPGVKIPSEATAVHGITDADVAQLRLHLAAVDDGEAHGEIAGGHGRSSERIRSFRALTSPASPAGRSSASAWTS